MTASGNTLTTSMPTPGDQVEQAGQTHAPMTLAAALPLVFDTNATTLSTALDSLAQICAWDCSSRAVRLSGTNDC